MGKRRNAQHSCLTPLAACRTKSFHILGIVENGRFRLPWRFDLAALAPVDPANRPLSMAVHRAPGLPRPRQAGARTNIRFKFQAIVTESIRRELYRARAVKIDEIRAPT